MICGALQPGSANRRQAGKPITMAINALFGFQTDIGLVMAMTCWSLWPGVLMIWFVRNPIARGCGLRAGGPDRLRAFRNVKGPCGLGLSADPFRESGTLRAVSGGGRQRQAASGSTKRALR